jgi:hypothetical protein
MSPLMAMIVLGVLLGSLVCIGAALLRKRGCALMTLPFPLLIVAWLVFLSKAPDAETEFNRLFGASTRALVSDIQIRKPLSMDGFLISFRSTSADYQRITETGFSSQLLGGLSFFGGARRPADWPAYLETMVEFDRRDYGEDYLLAHYDTKTQTTYAAFHYWGW